MYEWTAANSALPRARLQPGARPLKDKKVREALARALNRQDMIQVAENGLGQPQYSLHQPRQHQVVQPERREVRLRPGQGEAAPPGGRLQARRQPLLGPNGQPVKLQVLYPVSSAPRAKIAAYMQQQYKQLGIDLEVKGLDANAYFEETKKKNFDLSLGTWGGGSIDPDLGSKAQLHQRRARRTHRLQQQERRRPVQAGRRRAGRREAQADLRPTSRSWSTTSCRRSTCTR